MKRLPKMFVLTPREQIVVVLFLIILVGAVLLKQQFI
jgi:hypothetical protein